MTNGSGRPRALVDRALLAEDTSEDDVLSLILEELRCVREDVHEMGAQLAIMRQALVAHGKALGSLEQACSARLETCLSLFHGHGSRPPRSTQTPIPRPGPGPGDDGE